MDGAVTWACRWGLSLATVLCLAVAAPAAARDAEPAARLVILYATCTLNRDFVAPYDRRPTITPNLAAFAAQSVTFADHYTEAPSSGIAYASILTGSQADHHGVYRHPSTLSDDLYLIAEAYRDAGYDTFHWNRHGMVSPKLNYQQGVAPEHQFDERLTADRPEFRAILRRLAADPAYHALVLTTFTVTHGVYKKTELEPFREANPERVPAMKSSKLKSAIRRYQANFFGLSWAFPTMRRRLKLDDLRLAELARAAEFLYSANVHFLDQLFGEVVAAVDEQGLGEDSLIAFTADHGELLYRADADFKWSHSMSLEPEVLRVPLVIRLPGRQRAGHTHTGVTRSIDVFPTLAGLSGIAIPSEVGVAGRDLSDEITGRSPVSDQDAYSHTTVIPKEVLRGMRRRPANWTRVRALFPSADPDLIWAGLRRGSTSYKLRRHDGGAWHLEAFDVASDPTAAVDVFDASNPAHARAATDLRAYRRRLVEDFERRRDGGHERLVPPEQEEETLRALGYIE